MKILKKKIYLGIFNILIISILIYFVAAELDLFEKLIPFLISLEKYEVDELLFVGIVLMISLIVFSLKLWQENSILKIKVEVNQLKALIPICANCKKIRDDEGYWHQVESYIKSQTGTEFSHSLCNECAMKLYPEITLK